jgi:hypothetical protein
MGLPFAFARYLLPKYVGLRRELERYLVHYNFDCTHNGRLTKGRILLTSSAPQICIDSRTDVSLHLGGRTD